MSLSSKRPSGTPRIDVLIPAIEKDLKTLPYVIDAVRSQVKHPIGRILIVAPKRERMLALCRRKGCHFVDENTVLPITKKDIHYRSSKWERSGWMFQQLLKMGGDKLVTAKYFLVIDADTVLIRQHVFRSAGKTRFYCRNWSQPEYFRTYRKLLGQKPTASVSFVTHYMLYDKAKLARLKKTIEAKHGLPWYRAILRSMDKTKQFAFSEFETYGNYLHARHPQELVLKKALNKSLSMSVRKLTPAKRLQLAKSYRSISFHQRKDYVRGQKP